MKRPTSIIVISTLILMYNIVKIIMLIWIFLSWGAPLNVIKYFLLDFSYCLLCFISGILVLSWKKQGLKLYQISNFTMLFICIVVSYITKTSKDLTFTIMFVPVILWLILNTFVKKTKYFELK